MACLSVGERPVNSGTQRFNRTDVLRLAAKLLSFDGMRFCEQTQGIQADVRTELARFKADQRHTRAQLVRQRPMIKHFSAKFAPTCFNLYV